MLTIAYQYPATLLSTTYNYGYTGDAVDIDDPFDACDNQATYLIAHAYRDTSDDTYGKFWFSLTPPPQNVLISKLTLYVRCFTTAGTDYWSGDSCTIRGYLKPAGAGSDYAGVAAANFVNHWNQNQQPSGPTAVDFYNLGEWSTNPYTTASWTLQDLAALNVGYDLYVQSGETAQGATVGACVTQLYVRLECAPTAANLEPMRALGSLHLRLFRALSRKFTTVHGLEMLEVPMLGEAEASHALAPVPGGHGWRKEPGSRPRLVVVGKRVDLMNNKVSLEHIDLLDASCTFWASFVQDLGLTPDYQGMPVAQIGSGPPWVTRAQVNYLQRPGDGLVVDVPQDVMKVGKGGLWVEGEAKNWLLNSTFGLGSGTTFSYWTYLESGGGTITEETARPFVDITGQRRCPLLGCGSYSAYSMLEQSAVIGGVGRIVVWYEHNVPSASPALGLNIKRLDTNQFWDDASGTWDVAAGPVHFPVVAGKARWVSKPFTVPASTTVRVRVGITDAPPASDQSGWIYSAELLTCTDSAFPPAAGSPIVTTSAAITRVSDNCRIVNAPGALIWDHRKGRAIVTFEPNWNDADLPSNQEKLILSVSKIGTGEAGYMALLYEHVSGVAYWTFRLHDGTSATNNRISAAGRSLAIGQRVSIGALWTSANNEMGHGVSVFRFWVKDTLGLLTSSIVAQPYPWATLSMGSTSRVRFGVQDGNTHVESYPDVVYQGIDLDTIVPETDSILRWMGAQ
jgi:hypothetical protein